MLKLKLKTWHWIVLVLLVIFLVDWFAQRPDGRARDINRALETQSSPQLRSYPYKFRALRVEGDIAVMTTPRNVEVPALNFIRVIYPDIQVMNANDPAFLAAEQELASRQIEARTIALKQPGIQDVKWELDRHWLMSHGVAVPDKP